MRHATGQDTETLQFLGLPHLLVQALALGDVPVVDDNRAHRRLMEQILARAFNPPPGPVFVARPIFGGHDLTGVVQDLVEMSAGLCLVIVMNQIKHGSSG